MVSANAEYAYGYCAEYADQLPDWEWVKRKRGYRNKIFKDTHLYVGPGKLTIRGGFSVSTSEAFIQIHNKHFAKIMKKVERHYELYGYQICSYYKVVQGISPSDQPNYALMVPEITPLYKKSHMNYRLLSEFPSVLEHIFERGKAIFDNEINYDSELELLRSAILPESRLNVGNIGGQITLRLMINADKDFIVRVQEILSKPILEDVMLKIIPIIDEIIDDSPYIGN